MSQGCTPCPSPLFRALLSILQNFFLTFFDQFHRHRRAMSAGELAVQSLPALLTNFYGFVYVFISFGFFSAGLFRSSTVHPSGVFSHFPGRKYPVFLSPLACRGSLSFCLYLVQGPNLPLFHVLGRGRNPLEVRATGCGVAPGCLRVFFLSMKFSFFSGQIPTVDSDAMPFLPPDLSRHLVNHPSLPSLSCR